MGLEETPPEVMTASSPRPIPDFLASIYEPGALDRVDSTLAALDADANIIWVNDVWYRFASANGFDFTFDRYSSYLDGISGPLRTDYEEVFENVATTGTVFEQEYECSSPEVIRRYRMRVLPFLPDGLLVEHTQIASHEAPLGEAALEELYLDDDRQITQCSNCRRVRRALGEVESWVWVPEWVSRSHPATSHGICTPCRGYYWRRPRKR
jgi:hypothetical protein